MRHYLRMAKGFALGRSPIGAIAGALAIAVEDDVWGLGIWGSVFSEALTEADFGQ
ncbi:hypothetical protein [Pontibacter sp. G13]|uniref:hypothetical protein n=1 Tax=Pontibacter sp. G13 TaxID=3074898 RepID=UPI00288C0201|nr:hypothetical protein [Pontibacter sp. G13]WNJ19810.1 hypothetical protein RJD25_04945 [Pontibacter sp. G13]